MSTVRLPEPELFLPAKGEPSLRWGVIGPGWIAGEFVDAVRAHTHQRVTAIASRSLPRAQAFADAHGIDTAFGSVEQLVTHPEVDVVYVATPHSEHLAHGLAAIEAGKHVLIEKPIALDAAQARQLTEAGRRAGVLVMEGMWSRYLPQASVLRTLLADGVLGEIRSVFADHGQALPTDPSHRINRPELGGGALLDLGIYPVQFASMVLGAPDDVVAVGGRSSLGVDTYSTTVTTHVGGAQAVLYTSMLHRTPTTATISGTEGSIVFGRGFYGPSSFELIPPQYGAPTTRWADETGLTLMAGLSWEATALARFAGQGRTESPLHTHAETVSILETLDAARAQVLAGAGEDSEGTRA